MNTRSESEFVYNYEDKVKNKNQGLPDKVFFKRESLVIALFENPHVKTIHHIAIVLFLGLCFLTYIRGYLENDEVTIGFRLIKGSFRDVHISIITWLFIYFLVCCSYFIFLAWAKLRFQFFPKSLIRKQCDFLFLVVLLGYYLFSFSFIGHIVTIFNLPIGSAGIILIDQTRLLMKVHAFVRSNAPKVLQFKEKSDEILILPNFQYFVFFTWIPTLVYKDEYPRTNEIKWGRRAGYASEIIAVVFFYSFVLERFMIPLFKDFGLRKFSRSELFLALLESLLPGLMYLVVTFYLVLHLVQNLFAELLYFGDRMFYKDWWTSTDASTYFRKWNLVVHDWLYIYVYKDCYEILFPDNKNIATYVTFFLSSIVHEWIVAYMLGFFLPIMFILFFILGRIMNNVKFPQNSFYNTLFLIYLALGCGSLMAIYCLEFCARYNEVPSSAGSWDFYVPRFLTCGNCYTD
ncbi:sterol O-acyltransferase 1-like [Harmonia axyridis]|uniref:sterol O-acyltransferase 1-like n=1 Tax=Harmonia axyridis TaxID=115357 RepID=UPI001E27661A|nr:sterol O-acyltransferase 1-like [Harmonia axyridis]